MRPSHAQYGLPMEFESHSWVLWVGIIAAGLHVLEEYAEGWVAWANIEIGPRFGVEFDDTIFFSTNVLLLFAALAGAAIGWWAPAVSLAIPALFVINAIFFHMLPSARSEKLTPGTLSAIVIYLPVAAWMYWAAAEDGVLSFGTVFLSFVIGAALMAYPLAVLVLKSKIGWTEADAAAAVPAEDDAEIGDEPGAGAEEAAGEGPDENDAPTEVIERP